MREPVYLVDYTSKTIAHHPSHKKHRGENTSYPTGSKSYRGGHYLGESQACQEQDDNPRILQVPTKDIVAQGKFRVAFLEVVDYLMPFSIEGRHQKNQQT